MSRVRVALLALLALPVAAGCGMTGPGSVSSSSCENMAQGACMEQVERVGARHPGAQSIDLVCGVPECTRAGGAGTALVTLGDGSRVNDTFVYAGDPNPPPAPACTAVALDLCRSIAESAVQDQPPSKRIAGISIRCTAASCTQATGEVDITVTFGDGTRASYGHGWQGAP